MNDQGAGSQYEPGLKVRDVPSKGLSSRILGWKTSRRHVLLSNHELAYFYNLEWADAVVDIREQFLLPLDETQSIATKLDIRHPQYKDRLVSMTTDFVVTVLQNGTEIDVARTVKPSGSLTQRTLEKFEVERSFWLAHGIDWSILTEHEINKVVAKNVEWVHPYRSQAQLEHLFPAETLTKHLQRIQLVLTPIVIDQALSLAEASAICDDRLGYHPGTCLTVCRHLIARKAWPVDITRPIVPTGPLPVTCDGLSTGESVG